MTIRKKWHNTKDQTQHRNSWLRERQGKREPQNEELKEGMERKV